MVLIWFCFWFKFSAQTFGHNFLFSQTFSVWFEVRLFNIISQTNSNIIARNDLYPMLRDFVNRHPGLRFLESSPGFHKKYMETVVERMFFFNCCPHHDGNVFFEPDFVPRIISLSVKTNCETFLREIIRNWNDYILFWRRNLKFYLWCWLEWKN